MGRKAKHKQLEQPSTFFFNVTLYKKNVLRFFKKILIIFK